MRTVTRGSIVAIACLLASAAWAQSPEKPPAVPADQPGMQSPSDTQHDGQKKQMKGSQESSRDVRRSDQRAAAMREKLDDDQMVRLLGVIHQGEMQIADLALEKSDNQKVLDFAQQLREDHAWLDAKTVAVVDEDDLKGKNSELSRTVLRHAQATEKGLAKLEGHEFDRAFLSSQVAMHRDALGVLDAQQDNPNLDDDVQALIAQTIPSIQAHLDDAKNLLGGERAISSDEQERRRPVQTGTEQPIDEREPDGMEKDY